MQSSQFALGPIENDGFLGAGRVEQSADDASVSEIDWKRVLFSVEPNICEG